MAITAGEGQEKVRPVLVIGLSQDGKIAVSGNLKEKKMLLNCIAEAIKVIANFEPSRIIQPNVVVKPHRVMDFIRKRR